MKICVLGNQARAVFLFWKVLMRQMLAAGHAVFCLLPDGDPATEQSLRELGVRTVNYRLDRKDIATYFDLERVFKAERPDLLFASTIKPVIYGCMAAKRAGVRHIYATITGLGYAFEADSVFKKCINRLSITLYRMALQHIEGVFFQNRDDAELFRRVGILQDGARVLFARGTGVDVARFGERQGLPRVRRSGGHAEATVALRPLPGARPQRAGPWQHLRRGDCPVGQRRLRRVPRRGQGRAPVR